MVGGAGGILRDIQQCYDGSRACRDGAAIACNCCRDGMQPIRAIGVNKVHVCVCVKKECKNVDIFSMRYSKATVDVDVQFP